MIDENGFTLDISCQRVGNEPIRHRMLRAQQPKHVVLPDGDDGAGRDHRRGASGVRRLTGEASFSKKVSVAE
jgi:hypothetical protein